MAEAVFLELAVVLFAAFFLGFVFNKLRQPVLLGFVFAGIILGSSFLNVLSYKEFLTVFSDLGIAFLLFLVGLNLDLKVFGHIGRASVVTGVGQIMFTVGVGFILASAMGFNAVESAYLAVALAFSSTIIVVKLLSDKNELNSLYGKISVGFLLVQDFVAILALIFIGSLSFSSSLSAQLFHFVSGVVVLFLVFFAAKKWAKRVFDSLSRNQDLLFLGAISWCLAFASFSFLLGFSKEIGAFLAGVSLASLPYTYELLGKLRYLRDFFIVLFFVVLGSTLVFNSSNALFWPALVFSLFVLVGNPVIVFSLMAWMGYKGRTSFLSSLTVAQISEFSLILVFLGQKTGHISDQIVAIVTLVAVITISTTTYLILYNNRIYDWLSRHLPVLRTKRFFEDSLHLAQDKCYEVVFVGFGETSRKILSDAANLAGKKDVLVVDFDPSAVKLASEKGFNVFYGDVSDLDAVDFISKCKPKLVVSTIREVGSNVLLAKKISLKSPHTLLMVLAQNSNDAERLEKEGAGEVLVLTEIAANEVVRRIAALKKSKAVK